MCLKSSAFKIKVKLRLNGFQLYILHIYCAVAVKYFVPYTNLVYLVMLEEYQKTRSLFSSSSQTLVSLSLTKSTFR